MVNRYETDHESWNSATANLSGLTAGASYTYKIYWDTDCTPAKELAHATFTTDTPSIGATAALFDVAANPCV